MPRMASRDIIIYCRDHAENPSPRCPRDVHLCATATVFDECTVGLQYAWKTLNKKLKVFEIVDKCSALSSS